jgi:hypothetical protein
VLENWVVTCALRGVITSALEPQAVMRAYPWMCTHADIAIPHHV